MPLSRAQIVVPCWHFADTFAALTAQWGFQVDAIFPADAPSTAEVSGYGVSLYLVSRTHAPRDAPITLRLLGSWPPPLPLPLADIIIEWRDDTGGMEIPPGEQTFTITRATEAWGVGRAGMEYRDLIADRYGGRFIASHIRIPEGGAVPDYVHYHRVRFQFIYCRRGWVQVVYEDQGEPLVMHAGDAVLQPPGIRHRVLAASAGLEVIELGCPAIHETRSDPGLTLPNDRLAPEREFSGQRFVRHIAAHANWQPWMWLGQVVDGFVARDSGIGWATKGLAGVKVVRATGNAQTPMVLHTGELLFLFLLEGALVLRSDTHGEHTLHASDSLTIPAGMAVSLRVEKGVEFLEVAMPAA